MPTSGKKNKKIHNSIQNVSTLG